VLWSRHPDDSLSLSLWPGRRRIDRELEQACPRPDSICAPRVVFQRLASHVLIAADYHRQKDTRLENINSLTWLSSAHLGGVLADLLISLVDRLTRRPVVSDLFERRSVHHGAHILISAAAAAAHTPVRNAGT